MPQYVFVAITHIHRQRQRHGAPATLEGLHQLKQTKCKVVSPITNESGEQVFRLSESETHCHQRKKRERERNIK